MVNISVLIVTDERNVAHDLREKLIILGYKVVEIATPDEEIIAKIKEIKPDIILTDMHLNGARDGIKTGELIQSRYKNTPIIYITRSLGETTIEQRVFVLGFFL